MALKSRPREHKPDLTVQEALAITPNRPDPPKRRRKTHGRKTKKTISVFLFELFEANELADRKGKRTNAALGDAVIAEFPKNYKLAVALRSGLEKNGINHYRQKYNIGRLVPGRTVLHISFRYNELGDRVDYRTGKRLMPLTEQKKLLAKYQTAYMANLQAYLNPTPKVKKTNGKS